MFDHYIALDWSQKTMAFARMSAVSNKVDRRELPSSVKDFQLYLSRLRGRKILTFEETTTSQWLYTELRDAVDELIVCDPWRNRLLKDGPKTDTLDAEKLVLLLRGNLLKPVFHSGEAFLYLRKIVSGYEDIVKAGVRWKNQRFALFRANGQGKKETESKGGVVDQFVLEGIEKQLSLYEQEKERYEKEFHRLVRKHPVMRNLTSLPGIGEIGAVKIASRVVDPRRFPTRGAFWSYCGLVQLEKMSGGKSYGKKKPKYCRTLKAVFKSAAKIVIQDNMNNPLKDYYVALLQEKGCPEFQARHAVARRLATLALGIFKSEKKYQPERKENPQRKEDSVFSNADLSVQ
jgi:hypothetical protein